MPMLVNPSREEKPSLFFAKYTLLLVSNVAHKNFEYQVAAWDEL